MDHNILRISRGLILVFRDRDLVGDNEDFQAGELAAVVEDGAVLRVSISVELIRQTSSSNGCGIWLTDSSLQCKFAFRYRVTGSTSKLSTIPARYLSISATVKGICPVICR